jgi:CelD/BcsL family acetyltransferase involved in cellulose biosynthesis
MIRLRRMKYGIFLPSLIDWSNSAGCEDFADCFPFRKRGRAALKKMPSFQKGQPANEGIMAVNDLRLLAISSVDELRAAAPAWDDLWWRSDVAMPLLRAELLAQWIEQFKARAAFRALVVAEGDRWVAAMPLVSCHIRGLVSAAVLPGNPWVPCDDMLLDPMSDADAVCEMLLAEIARRRWPLLWLDAIVAETPRWQAFLRACQRAGIPTSYHQRWSVGRVEINQPWDVYQKRLPKNHRQGMVRVARRLACEGEVRFEMGSYLEPGQVEPWLREAFGVEDLSWKGQSGSSILRTRGMSEFFARQARELARLGQLETAALRLDGRMVAFLYGMRAKGVYFAHKISYDPSLAAFSPGQLLFHHILEQLHNDGQAQALDFIGPVNQAQSRWRPATYSIGRLVVAPRRWSGRAALLAYKHIWRRFADLRTSIASAPQPADHAELSHADARE